MARAALIPDSVAQVIALYEGPLAEVRFPDTDRESLVQLVDAVRGVSAELEEAERRLQTLQRTLTQQLEALGRKAEQGLQYGKVYAEGDVANAQMLQKQLARVTSPREAIRQVLEGLPFAMPAKEIREAKDVRDAKPRRRKTDAPDALTESAVVGASNAHEAMPGELSRESAYDTSSLRDDEAFADPAHPQN